MLGLIQFLETTAASLGTTTSKLANMSEVEQLEYVEKYFMPYAGKIETIEDIYMAIMIASGTVVILPGVVPHFFCGATAGVIGNASGGVRGATIGAFLQGILISFLPVFLMPVLGGLGFQGSTFSDADFGLSGIILGMLNQFGSQAGIVIGLVLILAVMFGVSFIKKPSAKEE